jgi:hypothetical protein
MVGEGRVLPFIDIVKMRSPPHGLRKESLVLTNCIRSICTFDEVIDFDVISLHEFNSFNRPNPPCFVLLKE